MSQLLAAIIMSLLLIVSCSSNEAYAQEQVAKPKTSQLRLGCGQSDKVIDYILSTMKEKAKYRALLSGKGVRYGQKTLNGRLYLLYSDNSWMITHEFFDPKTTDQDITCIVATGDQETAYDGTGFIAKELPTDIIEGALSVSLDEPI